MSNTVHELINAPISTADVSATIAELRDRVIATQTQYVNLVTTSGIDFPYMIQAHEEVLDAIVMIAEHERLAQLSTHSTVRRDLMQRAISLKQFASRMAAVFEASYAVDRTIPPETESSNVPGANTTGPDTTVESPSSAVITSDQMHNQLH